MTEPTRTQNPAREPGSPKRAVLYLRVASARPADWDAIPAQRAACQRWAREHGIDIVDEHVDTGRSGRTVDRPGLQALLAGLDNGPQVDYVLVEQVARLSRDVKVHERVLSALAHSGTKLVSADEADLATAQNEAVSLLKLVMAAAYGRDRVRDRQPRDGSKAGITPSSRKPKGA
jgi:DNA invertase Pin-like site-specific DNA recombinase